MRVLKRSTESRENEVKELRSKTRLRVEELLTPIHKAILTTLPAQFEIYKMKEEQSRLYLSEKDSIDIDDPRIHFVKHDSDVFGGTLEDAANRIIYAAEKGRFILRKVEETRAWANSEILGSETEEEMNDVLGNIAKSLTELQNG